MSSDMMIRSESFLKRYSKMFLHLTLLSFAIWVAMTMWSDYCKGHMSECTDVDAKMYDKSSISMITIACVSAALFSLSVVMGYLR